MLQVLGFGVVWFRFSIDCSLFDLRSSGLGFSGLILESSIFGFRLSGSDIANEACRDSGCRVFGFAVFDFRVFGSRFSDFLGCRVNGLRTWL